MASSSQQKYGFEDSRFQQIVSVNFHCSICLNVLKDPMTCRDNQHLFCGNCIAIHLQNDSTCPECRQELTADTLKPERVVANYLNELLIKCDYFSRGCIEFIQVGNLDRHVVECGFAPVKCSNNGCDDVAINKRDIVHHEMETCQFRKSKCHGCGELRKEIDEMKRNQQKMMKNLDEMKRNQQGMNDQLSQIVQQNNNMQDILVQVFEKMKYINDKENLKEVMRNQAVMQKQLYQLTRKLNTEQDLPISKPLRGAQTNKDIIIAGGLTSEGWTGYVETYNWGKCEWAQLPDLKVARIAASSFVYQNQVFAAGGLDDYGVTCDIEVMDTDQEPLQWRPFPGQLPTTLRDHKTVVFENKLIVTGGSTDELCSNNIYETLLDPPYSTTLLSRMVMPRASHGTELVNNKVFILGGWTSYSYEDIVDNVCVYDVVKKECKEMPPLPYAVSSMSTVVWRNKIIVIGGHDRDGEILNKVVSYDVETGESEEMPSMKNKRCECSAVATGDGMVVMGGVNENNELLKSVEYFNMNIGLWQELPPMIKPRSYACAVAKP